MDHFIQRHQEDVIGVLSGFDRLLFRGADINAVLGRMLMDTAESAGIAHQHRAANTPLSNNSSAFQVCRGGVAAATVGIPNRYMHTSVEVVSLGDVDKAIDLLVSWIAGLGGEVNFNPIQ